MRRHSEQWRTGTVLLVALVASAMGVLTGMQPGAAAAVAAALVLVAVLSLMRSFLPPADLSGRRFRWVSLAWAYLLILPVGHFTTGRTALTAVAGIPSVENVVDLVASAAIAALALWSLKRNRIGGRPSLLIFGLPVLAFLSTAWSLTPTTTLGFSFELVATVLLATLTAAILNADPSLGRSIVLRTLRIVVLTVAVLCVVGLIVRSGWLPPDSPTGTPRFTWPGGHPLVAGAEIGFAVLVILFGGRRDTRLSLPFSVALLGLFAVCLYLADARTAFAGLAASGLFGYWFVSKGSARGRRIAGATAIALAVLVLASSFGGPITEYLYRGQTQQQVYSLDGRLALWTTGLQQLHSPGRWLFGYGLSGTRVLFASSVSWAADAHSAWLELLLSLGLVGVATAVSLVVVLAARLVRGPPDRPLASRVLPVLFVYVLAMGVTGDVFGAPGPEPGLGFTLLGLCYAATAWRRRVWSPAVAPPSVPVERELSPAPI